MLKIDVSEFDLRYDDKRTNIFFVPSTGRSGSQSIAATLSKISTVTCLHEPRPKLNWLSSQLANGKKSKQKVKRKLYSIYCRHGKYPEGSYGESDQKLWNLVSLLAECIPSSKFIWLIRDGRDVVASIYSRGWFSKSEQEKGYANGKLHEEMIKARVYGDNCGYFKRDEWAAMCDFERCCWYWFYVNEAIEKQLNRLPVECYFFVKLEELSKRIEELCDFLGVTDEHAPLRVEHLNKANYSLKKWVDWTDDEKRIFEHWCGASMNKWYNGWRNTNRYL